MVFAATCKKPRTYRDFCVFWINSIGIYGVFWSLSAENCVNTMILERFWTSGKQRLLIFTGVCQRNAWKTLVFEGFSHVFHCDFINVSNPLAGLAGWQNVTPPRARATLPNLHPFPWSFYLGCIAGVRSLSIIHVHPLGIEYFRFPWGSSWKVDKLNVVTDDPHICFSSK